MIFTDCVPPDDTPPNVFYYPTTLEAVRELASSRLGVEVALHGPRKLCDMKPTYGMLFEEHLSDFDFWGFCDLDIIWGNIRSFWTDEILDNHDLVTTRKELVAGHMCILRNSPDCRRLPLEHPRFREIMQDPNHHWYDEKGFSEWVTMSANAGRIRVYWPSYMINFHQPVDDSPSVLSWLDSYKWDQGRLYSLSENGEEILYLHFMNWKDTLKWCQVDPLKEGAPLMINYCSISTPGCPPPGIYRIKMCVQTLSKPKLYILHIYRWFRRIKCVQAKR